MKVIAIIQARSTNTRLPGKSLLPLGDSHTLDYLLKRVSQIKGLSEVVVAVPDNGSEDIAEWCQSNNITLFRGAEHDVLERYILCARKYSPDYVMRITADCPLVDYETASRMIEIMKIERGDVMRCDVERPRGLSVEIISMSALEYIHSLTDLEERHREHVTYYAYEFKDKFKVVNYTVEEVPLHSEMSITLDTIEDYNMLVELTNLVKDPLVPATEVIRLLEEHDEIRVINKHIEQKAVI